MLAALWMIAVAQMAPAYSVEPTADGIRLVAQANGLPVEIASLKIGPVVDVLRHGDAIYAALVDGGVAVVSVRDPAKPQVVSHLASGRVVQRLTHDGADVLVLSFADRDTAAFSLADPLAPTPTVPAVAEAHEIATNVLAAHGTVLGVRDGTVVIAGGSAAGFREGEHVAIVSRRIAAPSDAMAQSVGMSPSGTRTAVILLERVQADRALGHLGRGDRAEVGDEVQATSDELTSSIFFPRANAFDWRLWTTLRPFFNANTGTQSAGALIDLMAAYYFRSVPLRLEAGVQPIGFAEGANRAHNPLVAIADIAYSSPYFELGFGSGMSVLASSATGSGIPCTFGNNCNLVATSTASPLLVETLRLGALDGLNFSWIAAAGVVPNQGFQLLSARGEVNVPVASRVAVFAGGGGGLGYFYGEAGARTLLNGVGGAGTVILSAGVGGVGITDNAPEVLSGPALTLGCELRL